LTRREGRARREPFRPRAVGTVVELAKAELVMADEFCARLTSK
jgi:hypothetical protein